MKQLDVVVSPPAFIWDPNLTLTHVTFDLDPSDLWPLGQMSKKLQKILEKKIFFRHGDLDLWPMTLTLIRDLDIILRYSDPTLNGSIVMKFFLVFFF